MNLTKLLSQGFVTRETIERMRKTEPGALADALDLVLYNSDTGDKFQCSNTQRRMYFGGDHIWPKWNGLSEDGKQFDVGKLLREIHQYLEACALRTVLSNESIH